MGDDAYSNEESGKRKLFDLPTLRLGYQRKASEYVLRMAFVDRNINNGNQKELNNESSPKDSDSQSSFLVEIGQRIITNLLSNTTSMKTALHDTMDHHSNTVKQTKRMRFLNSATTSQIQYFQHKLPLTSTIDHNGTEAVSNHCIGFISKHIEELMRSSVGCTNTCSLLWNSFEFSCPICGTPFHLDSENECIRPTVRVRLLQRGKCRRRRSLRYIRKQALCDQQTLKKQGGGKTFAATQTIPDSGKDPNIVSHGSLIASLFDAKQKRRREHVVRRIRDGCSKNKVVYTCGYCRWKSCLKGIPAVISKRFDLDVKTISSGRVHLAKDNQGPMSSVTAKKSDPVITSPKESIGSLMKCTPAKRKIENAKINKGVVKKGKSSLMEFLSSLND